MLTIDQLTVLKADMLANAGSLPPFAEEIAQWYNATASPPFIVWRTRVTQAEFAGAIMNTSGAATQLDALTASKRDTLFEAMHWEVYSPDPAPRVAAFDDFCGSQNTLKAALAAVQKRSATRAEKLFATGTGSTAAPATMSFEGMLTYQDVEAAQQLP